MYGFQKNDPKLVEKEAEVEVFCAKFEHLLGLLCTKLIQWAKTVQAATILALAIY